MKKMKNKLSSVFNVKTIIASCFILIFSGALKAQSNQEEIDLYQSMFGMQKKEMITSFLKLDSNSPFWVDYDAYELERKALGQKRLAILSDYAENYLSLSEEKTDDLIKQMQVQKKSLDKLIDKYYKKVKKTSGSKVAAQFYQFENYILTALRSEILDGIPFFGELD